MLFGGVVRHALYICKTVKFQWAHCNRMFFVLFCNDVWFSKARLPAWQTLSSHSLSLIKKTIDSYESVVCRLFNQNHTAQISVVGFTNKSLISVHSVHQIMYSLALAWKKVSYWIQNTNKWVREVFIFQFCPNQN